MAASRHGAWYRTKQGFALFALIEFAAAYLFASLAINSGSLLQWFLTFVLLLAGIQNVGKLAIALWKKGRGKS